MDELLEKLVVLLEQETLFWESLDLLLQRKKKAVINAEIEAVNRITREVEILKQKIGQAEDRRREMLRQVALAMNCSPDELSLKKLSEIVQEPHALRLAECRSKFLITVERIRVINNSIHSLLSHAIQMVGMSFSVLSGMMTPHTVYGDTGAEMRGDQSGRVLSQNI